MPSITERIDAITRIPPEYRNTVLPAPKSVKIELTGRCNYRCSFCALSSREKQPTQDIDFNFFCRVAEEMSSAGVRELGLFYIGESFMNPDLLVKAIAVAKGRYGFKFPYVFLTTNGSLAAPDVVKACMEAGLNSLKFSLNATGANQFRQVMRVKPQLYETALENLAAARRIRDEGSYSCGLYASSIQFDGEQQRAMETLIEERVRPYVDEHYWLPLYSMGSFATEREAQLGFKPIAGNQGRIGALRDPLPCWSVFTEGHITSAGLLSACCFDPSGAWAMADLKVVSFMSGWNSEKFQALRAAHLRGDVTGTACDPCIVY